MKNMIDISVGLDKIAKFFLLKKIDKNSNKFIYNSIGKCHSIKLYKYKLNDGSFAEEYLQFITENEFGQSIHFIGLKTEKKRFEWSAEKILKVLEKKSNF